MKILVITELRQGKWNNASFETLAAAQQIAKDTLSNVSALVIGKGVAAFADELAAKHVAEVLRVEHDLLEAYTPDGYCVALKQVIEGAKPDLVLFPHTYQVRDFAPKLAAMLGKGMIGDCIGYRNEGGKLVFVRPREKPRRTSRLPERHPGSHRFNREHFARICSPRILLERPR